MFDEDSVCTCIIRPPGEKKGEKKPQPSFVKLPITDLEVWWQSTFNKHVLHELTADVNILSANQPRAGVTHRHHTLGVARLSKPLV